MSRSAPTPEERAKLRELHAKATQGEWRTYKWQVVIGEEVAGFPTNDDAALVVAAHNALPGLLDALDAAEAEIARLQAGGCARDQHTTQHCAEAVGLAAENKRLREALERISNEGVEWDALIADHALKGTT